MPFEQFVDARTFFGKRSQSVATVGADWIDQPQERYAFELVVDAKRVIDVKAQGFDPQHYFGPGPVTIRTKSPGRIHLRIAAATRAAVTESS